MVVEAKRTEAHLEGPGKDFKPEPPDKVQDEVQGQRLDTIYDDEPFWVSKRIRWELVEIKLPIMLGKKPIKQTLRRFAPEVLLKIKEEVERLLKCNFIHTTRYVEWIANIVPVIKKSDTLRICIDFRDLNDATLKDEYPIPVAEMLVDSAIGHKYLSMLDEYSGYN
ncbi:uncharacterized protein LOC127104792 [Lathyrus oleraceus]|uniref:uncharacterized protein LOC127104792 n=1 Tax=Pisum sativum TaxID=3888 RepID=UPI0021D01B84|nr:uncharacterized protein LOC127104792 [Pisum sativum]